jgi:hypothetical protein
VTDSLEIDMADLTFPLTEVSLLKPTTWLDPQVSVDVGGEMLDASLPIDYYLTIDYLV